MKGRNSLKNKPKGRLSYCPKESLSESSFLSENFCTTVLGKPCREKKKNLIFAGGDFNKKICNEKYNFGKQQVLVYNVTEENINSKDKMERQFSTLNEENTFENEEGSETGSIISINRNSISRLQEREETRSETEIPENSAIDPKRETSDYRSSISSKKSELHNENSETERLESEYRNSISSRRSESYNDSSREKQRQSDSRGSVSSRRSEIHSREGQLQSENRGSTSSKRSESRNDRSGSENISNNTSSRRIEPSNGISRPERLASSNAQENYENNKVDEVVHKNNGTIPEYDNSESSHPKIRVTSKEVPGFCYCENTSQTNYPSILKPPYRQSISSNMDTYPVRDVGASVPSRNKLFVDKMLQTSDNSIFNVKSTKNGKSSTDQNASVDTSMNISKPQSTGIQATSTNSIKVQTSDGTDSSTSEEICYRPIKNYCRCDNVPTMISNRAHQRQENVPPNDYAYRDDDMDSDGMYPSARTTCFRALPKQIPRIYNNRDHYISSPTRELDKAKNISPIMLQKYDASLRQQKKLQKGIFTETPADVIQCKCFAREVDKDEYSRQLNQYTYDQEYNPRRFQTERDNFIPCATYCRCFKETDSKITSFRNKKSPYRPSLPPIDYIVSSSDDDDIELAINEPEDSDDDYYFDQPNNKLRGYQDLPYQNNEQYIDLVQELGDTLQSRNKNRVQRALNEFECRSKYNKPLERPINDYEEASESEEPIIRRISELAEKRMNNHKRFPCKGQVCCNCIVRKDRNESKEKKVKPTKINTKPPSKKKTLWKMNNKTGDWHKVSSDTPKQPLRLPSYRKDHVCGCECSCAR